MDALVCESPTTRRLPCIDTEGIPTTTMGSLGIAGLDGAAVVVGAAPFAGEWWLLLFCGGCAWPFGWCW